MNEMMPFWLYTVAATSEPIRATSGLHIIPDYTVDSANRLKKNMKTKMSNLLATGSLLLLVTACGDGSSSSTPAPTPNFAPAAPQNLSIQDSVPRENAMMVDPMFGDLTFSHLGYADLAFSYSGDCTEGTTVRRSLVDLSGQDFDELLDHKLRCTTLSANQTYTVGIDGQRTSGALFEVGLTFSTGIGSAPNINVLDSVMSPRDSVETMFRNYVIGSLLSKLDLPKAIEALILPSVLDLVDDSWPNLTQPGALYGVTSQRVNYPSRDPDGNESSALTGLVVVPDTSGPFTPRNRILVLSHSTGSTPGDLDPTNTWYVLANVLASLGYLVIAADNWGRGYTSGEPETYLMANRTAANSLDLVRGVLTDDEYGEFYTPGNTAEFSIIGYSQGGHSAIALWQALVTQAPDDMVVREVYAGAGPYNLYQTLRGVLQHLDNSCNAGAYCRYVDTETTVPFATNRILPGFLDYTNTGLTAADIIDGDSLTSEFVTGFLNNEQAYDNLKLLLQQNSFVNVTSVADSYSNSTALLRLYHSDYDRLVPVANTAELVATLDPHQTVEFRNEICNASEFETIFNLTDFVGIVHTLCGLSMMNDVMAEFR